MDNMIMDTIIQSKYPPVLGIRTPEDICQLVVHGSGGGTTCEGLRNYWYSPESEAVVKKKRENGEVPREDRYKINIGLTQYNIGRNGMVMEVYPPLTMLKHTNVDHYDWKNVGVELLNPHPTNQTPYSDIQYTSLADLYGMLALLFPSMSEIIGHGMVQSFYQGRWYKACPGEGFDWELFREKMLAKGFAFKIGMERIYEIKYIGG